MSSAPASLSAAMRQGGVATLAFALVVAGFLGTGWLALASLHDRSTALTSASSLLEQLEGRSPARGGAGTGISRRTGSPFLEGQSVTIAGAALQQRIDAAVKAVGGNVLSSQVDVQGNDARRGYVSLIASCEVDQPGLQQLLYDIEAGMPFLFVDQLTVQAPQAVGDIGAGRLRVLLGVSGRWQGAT